MNLYDLTTYVSQEVDDNYTSEEVARWFNKGIANYNLIPPLTTYPIIEVDDEYTDYTHLPDTFMLAIMLPFISSSIRSSEASLSEKQLFMQEFLMNARTYKSATNIKQGYLLNGADNPELSQYQLGENVYLTDFTQAPFAGDWNKASVYKEYVVTRKNDGTIVKYVDDSLVEEDVETMEEEAIY